MRFVSLCFVIRLHKQKAEHTKCKRAKARGEISKAKGHKGKRIMNVLESTLRSMRSMSTIKIFNGFNASMNNGGISKGTCGISKGTRGIYTGVSGISKGTRGISKGTRGISKGTRGISKGTRGISKGTRDIYTEVSGISKGTRGISKGTRGISKETRRINTNTGVSGINTNNAVAGGIKSNNVSKARLHSDAATSAATSGASTASSKATSGAATSGAKKTTLQLIDEVHTIGLAACVLAGGASGIAALVYATAVEDAKEQAKTLGGTAEFFVDVLGAFSLAEFASKSLPCAVAATGSACALGVAFGFVAGWVWPVAIPVGAVIYISNNSKGDKGGQEGQDNKGEGGGQDNKEDKGAGQGGQGEGQGDEGGGQGDKD
jgi:hypothetical protein